MVLISSYQRHIASWDLVVIVSGNALSPLWDQAIALTNDDLL